LEHQIYHPNEIGKNTAPKALSQHDISFSLIQTCSLTLQDVVSIAQKKMWQQHPVPHL
jgi:hypothetical protein